MAGGCNELSDKSSKSTSNCPPSKKDTKDSDDSELKKKQKQKQCGKNMLKSRQAGCCKDKPKCAGTGKDAFGRKVCPPKEEKKIECHESRKKFFEDRDKSCDISDEEECEEPKEDTDCEDSSTKDECFKMPAPQVMTIRPCLPKVEKGISCKKRKVVSCISTGNCPHLKKPNKAEFFLIDARNTMMTEFMKQYTKADPNKMNTLYTQFINKRMHTVAQDHTPCGYQGLPTLPPRRGYPKLQQLLKRWAPTAGLYVAATALVTVWVTEWDTVVKHIPFYRPEEEVPIGKKIPSMAQDVPADIPSQDDDSGDSTST